MSQTIEIIPGDGGDEPLCLETETRVFAILSRGGWNGATPAEAGAVAGRSFMLVTYGTPGQDNLNPSTLPNAEFQVMASGT